MQPTILFLAAGYGSRLQRDLLLDSRYAGLAGIPKPLLPLNGSPLISIWIASLANQLQTTAADLHKQIRIVCNAMNHHQLLEWASSSNFPKEHIQSDGTLTNETRLGAIRDLNFAINIFQIKTPVLVIAGDTLFLHDFRYNAFVAAASSSMDVLMCHYTLLNETDTLKTGILITDTQESDGRIESLVNAIGFLEKPDPATTTSRFACPCFYFFKPSVYPKLQQFLDIKGESGSVLDEIDATGRFIAYLVGSTDMDVKSFKISGRLDIGGLESYIVADEYVTRHNL